jgi:hypothetical protein
VLKALVVPPDGAAAPYDRGTLDHLAAAPRGGDALEKEFGVPVRWSEVKSRTTHENARDSAEILKAAGISHIVLVVHGADMARPSTDSPMSELRSLRWPRESCLQSLSRRWISFPE